MTPTLEYFASLTKEQINEAVAAMSPAARSALIGELCGAVGTMTRSIVENADEIWENR